VDAPLESHYLSRTATPFTLFNAAKGTLYSESFTSALSGAVSDSVTRRLFEVVKGASRLNQMLYVDTKSWLPDDLLLKADKMTMAASVELRVPLLDPSILEFAASLPQGYKVRGTTLKRVLKAALQQQIPTEILRRKKAGFPVPYNSWMRSELREFVFDTILAANSIALILFRKNSVKQLLVAHQRGERCAKEVFSLLVLELWHQQFVVTPTSA
jgi:asparagine synthase (glutamine-hydrolysing)